MSRAAGGNQHLRALRRARRRGRRSQARAAPRGPGRARTGRRASRAARTGAAGTGGCGSQQGGAVSVGGILPLPTRSSSPGLLGCLPLQAVPARLTSVTAPSSRSVSSAHRTACSAWPSLLQGLGFTKTSSGRGPTQKPGLAEESTRVRLRQQAGCRRLLTCTGCCRGLPRHAPSPAAGGTA